MISIPAVLLEQIVAYLEDHPSASGRILLNMIRTYAQPVKDDADRPV